MNQQFINGPKWGKIVQKFLRSELAKKDIDYPELSERLLALGTHQTPANLRSKVSKGILGAQLLFQILLVLRVRKLDWELIEELYEDSTGVEKPVVDSDNTP
ncbi:MAG: hypothetical protein COC09_00530 [Gammaproteobacteria bacterium]|nr:hypothetical protein [Gammaproteobacteria bacterium]PCH63523.1 MAG: hypothetical protein COC09_05655 [Gammaproteobacteria bacterium]PCH64992.1 MAG: hypothetical protein COC09_00530 [Gammaproteobacteria bacterium]